MKVEVMIINSKVCLYALYFEYFADVHQNLKLT